jgi:hypothetical protein
MPPIVKKHRKSLISGFDFPDVKEEDRYVPVSNEALLCDASKRYGFSEVNHFRCAVCRRDKPEKDFDKGTCKKCKQ